MWRDPHLPVWHAARGIPFPAEGMTLPMVEYDHGMPVGLVSYINRNQSLPTYGNSYHALAGLFKVSGEQLPFLTAQYDPFNWAFCLIGHNEAARKLLGVDGWKTMTERGFVKILYAMRGRQIPALEKYGVRLYDLPWYQDHLSPVRSDEDTLPWPGADISKRRREYEPVNPDGTHARFSLRNPCADLDLAVCSSDGRLRLVVDYKGPGALVDHGNSTHRALSGFYRQGGHQVPYVVARTLPDGTGLELLGVNAAGRKLINPPPVRIAGALPPDDGLVTPPDNGDWHQTDWPTWAGMLGDLSAYQQPGRMSD